MYETTEKELLRCCQVIDVTTCPLESCYDISKGSDVTCSWNANR